MDKLIKPDVLKTIADAAKPVLRYAYYMQPINGGYQLHRLSIQEDLVLEDTAVEDPDGWPEVLGYLEAEFSKEHFSK